MGKYTENEVPPEMPVRSCRNSRRGGDGGWIGGPEAGRASEEQEVPPFRPVHPGGTHFSPYEQEFVPNLTGILVPVCMSHENQVPPNACAEEEQDMHPMAGKRGQEQEFAPNSA